MYVILMTSVFPREKRKTIPLYVKNALELIKALQTFQHKWVSPANGTSDPH